MKRSSFVMEETRTPDLEKRFEDMKNVLFKCLTEHLGENDWDDISRLSGDANRMWIGLNLEIGNHSYNVGVSITDEKEDKGYLCVTFGGLDYKETGMNNDFLEGDATLKDFQWLMRVILKTEFKYAVNKREGLKYYLMPEYQIYDRADGEETRSPTEISKEKAKEYIDEKTGNRGHIFVSIADL